jgi:hypothetical protein
MSAIAASACQWRADAGGAAAAEQCLAFLDQIGIELDRIADHEAQLLDGLAIVEGRLLIDPAVPVWPSDLLHEAGHIAVCASEARARLGPVEADGGDEMAALAGSYAASLQCGVSLDLLFDDGGYRGDSAMLREAFASGAYVGVPMLGFFGLCDPDGHPADHPFPPMKRWLR